MRKGNVDKIAAALGISPRRIRGLVAENVLPKPKRGIYNIGKCVRAYEQYRLETNKRYRMQRQAEQCQRDLDAGRPLRMSIELWAIELGISERWLRERFRQAGLI